MNSLLPTLLGTWFIVSTNFPMWLKGNKVNPTFTYSLAPAGRPASVLLDEVKYVQNGRQKTLTGYDYPDERNSTAFVWRGKGLLSLVRSNWKVALLAPDGQWAVIWFSKTLFTPEGVDIISRSPQLSPQTVEQIRSLMAQDAQLAPHISTLRSLPTP